MCAAGAVFPNLVTLWVGNNSINTWESVDSLAALTALQELRLSGNPVLQGPMGETRFEVSILIFENCVAAWQL